MTQPAGFVDIHCHLIPAIDDGAKSWDESLAMARMAVADGIETIVATPHQLGSYADNDGDTIRQRVTELQQRLRDEQIPLTVLAGADVRIEPGLVSLVRQGKVLSLADRKRHVLLELPHEMFVPLDRLLAELAGAGMVGILSHPERNRGILSQPQVVAPLVEAGCLMQVTAGSLTGCFGSTVQNFSDWLIAEGLVHFVSTDAHGTRTRCPQLRAAYDRVVELAGQQTADDLCRSNPAAVAAGQPVAATRRPAKPARAGWFSWKRAA